MDPTRIKLFQHLMQKNTDLGKRGIPDSWAIRYYEEDKSDIDIRPPFFRDVDRIVHSKAYARYIDKTQVFFGVANANITHRSLHVLLVSRVSRQVGRVLKLNSDLIEAIALGHDIGHSPFGHLREQILDEVSEEYGMGNFNHNAQGVRWLTFLEKRFPKEAANGLNLTLQVLDGILCHDGEIYERDLKPRKINGKNWDDHDKEYQDAIAKNKIRKIPTTFEAITVRFADSIAYIGRDIEDAILLKFIKREEIPLVCKKVLGDTNRKIMKSLIMDLLNYSLENETIGYSEEVYEALRELKVFNYERIYTRRDLMIGNGALFLDRLKEKFQLIFKTALKDLKDNKYDSPVFNDHVAYIDDSEYTTYYQPLLDQNKLTLIVRDYIAGMSDKYFEEVYYKFQKN